MISFLLFFSRSCFFFFFLSLYTQSLTVFFETCPFRFSPFFFIFFYRLLSPCGIHLISALLSNRNFSLKLLLLRYILHVHEAIAPILICPFFFLFFYFNPTRETVLSITSPLFFFFFYLFTQGGGKRVIEAFFMFLQIFFLFLIYVKMCFYYYMYLKSMNFLS